MEQKEQTAVEWLVEQLFADNEIFGCSKELLEQAKQMEKEQIIDTYKKAQVLMVMDSSKQAEQYYNEEYGTRVD